MAGRKVNKEAKKKSNGFWRIVISMVGIALILIAISNVMLFFFGESVYAKVNTRRVGGANDGAPATRRYEWSVDYTFKDHEGIEREGHITRRGSDTKVEFSNTVYYLPFAPFIHALEDGVRPSIGHLIYSGLGVFLIYVMNKGKRKASGNRKSRYKTVIKPNGEIDVPDLTDYDDSVEEVYHDRD